MVVSVFKTVYKLREVFSQQVREPFLDPVDQQHRVVFMYHSVQYAVRSAVRFQQPHHGFDRFFVKGEHASPFT